MRGSRRCVRRAPTECSRGPRHIRRGQLVSRSISRACTVAPEVQSPMGLNPNATFTWYGHSCWKLTTPGGKTVLLDPWFANPTSPQPAADVDHCDLMLVTHGHFDHFGDALAIASRTHP